jgi:putative DNA primase/helicase
VTGDGSKAERQIAFDTDLHKLEQFLLERRNIRFLVVDPISSYLGEASMVKETDVRRVLVPLAELAARLEITVLLIAHLNKRSDVSALHKIMGAVAISGVARAAWMFAEDPENEDAYLMVRGKLNVGKKTEGLRYCIEAKEIPDCGEAPFIKWDGTTEVSAGQVFGLFGPMESTKADKAGDAVAWLKGFLMAGRKAADDVVNTASREGFKERTLRKAKSTLGVVSEKDGDTWYWQLPEENQGCI